MSDASVSFERIPLAKCSQCGVVLDLKDCELFSRVQCPNCHTDKVVPARFGNHILLSEIGHGAMGVVYRSMDPMLDRVDAVKVLRESEAEQPGFLETLRKEAQAAARINNPHVAQVYSFGIEKGQPFIVMEFVEGTSLKDLIGDDRPVDPYLAMKAGIDVADGLSAAWEMGLVHGDIKPENILFNQKFDAKVIDFGLASIVERAEKATSVWGSPYYISPERMKRIPLDLRSDMYSLGATLYHALSGHPPFEGDDAVKVARARIDRAPKDVRRWQPDVPDAVAEVVMRMLHPDRAMRHPTYKSLINDMQRAMAEMKRAKKRYAAMGNSLNEKSLKNLGVRHLLREVNMAETVDLARTEAVAVKMDTEVYSKARVVRAVRVSHRDVSSRRQTSQIKQTSQIAEKRASHGPSVAFYMLIMAAVIVAAVLGVKAVLPPADSWKPASVSGRSVYRMQIGFPGYNRGEPLKNFPVLVILGEHIPGFSYKQFKSSGGLDLRFTDGGGNTVLSYEIERWNPAGRSYVWVQVPELGGGRTIHASWGPANGVLAPDKVGWATWMGDFAAVWHMSEEGGDRIDSTARKVRAANTNDPPARIDGRIGAGVHFDRGRDQYLTAACDAMNNWNELTWSLWVRGAQQNEYSRLLEKGANSEVGLVLDDPEHSGRLSVQNGSRVICRSAGKLTDGKWHHVALRITAQSAGPKRDVFVYVDGVKQGETPWQTFRMNDTGAFRIGGFAGGSKAFNFDGDMDEVRISTVARSGNWIWAEWMNVASNSVFNSYGPVD